MSMLLDRTSSDVDSQGSDTSVGSSLPESSFGVRLSAVEAMMTNCCGKIEAQLHALEDANVISRISGLE
eukprot:CAMPEP_0172905774 /NCGR_PEP_ID=MMETSP1075-20121228/175396_1 /TAXON_ID=2916 /ORGANISM="Ceratium fusus, Strain PA161109" /LENGTH=68 /DNA_ID=CAMNT_0013763075 /DNA_START=10 /DNA_END=213 /DNA_ORIENTATION=+